MAKKTTATKKNTKATKAKAETPAKGPGRQPSEETQKRIDHILARVKEEPGILSADLARELDMGSLPCSQLGDRLVKSGQIAMFKLASGQRSYYMPGVLKRKLASLEKARDKELAERAAKKSDPLKKPKSKAAAKAEPAKRTRKKKAA